MQFSHPIIVFYFPFQGIDLGADRDFYTSSSTYKNTNDCYVQL